MDVSNFEILRETALAVGKYVEIASNSWEKLLSALPRAPSKVANACFGAFIKNDSHVKRLIFDGILWHLPAEGQIAKSSRKSSDFWGISEPLNGIMMGWRSE